MVAERRCDEPDANVLEPAAPSQLVSRLSDVKEIIKDWWRRTLSSPKQLFCRPAFWTMRLQSADHTAAQFSTERVQQRIVEHTQSLDPVKDVLVVIQIQVPVQRMVETPQLRFIAIIANDLSNVNRKGSNYQDCEALFPINRQGPDIAGGVHVGKKDHDDVSVVTQRQISTVQTVQKTKEIPQLQCIDKVVDNPVVQVPRVQVVEKIVEIPQLQTVEKIAETPQTQTMQGTQTPEEFGHYTCLSSGTDGTCGSDRDRDAASYRIRITHVRLNTSSAGCGGTG